MTTSSTNTRTSTVPPDLVGYTAKERAAYAAAVAAYRSFATRNDHFYAVGKTTVAAKDFYHRYSISWATAWGDLAEVVNNNATVSGPTRTLWTRPVSISADTSHGDAVTFRRCLDESKRVVIQNGKRLAQPQLKTPHVYTVRLEKSRGEGWWRSGEPVQGATC